jgi:hypothetical protein
MRSKHTQTQALTADKSTAVDADTLRTRGAGSPHVVTAQVITGQATTSATWWGAQRSREHFMVILWRSAPTAKGITLCSATDGLSNRCTEKTEAVKTARQSTVIESAGWASSNAATGVASGTNRAMLVHRPKGIAKKGGGRGAE